MHVVHRRKFIPMFREALLRRSTSIRGEMDVSSNCVLFHHFRTLSSTSSMSSIAIIISGVQDLFRQGRDTVGDDRVLQTFPRWQRRLLAEEYSQV